MNPKPFSSLNHFTTPVAMCLQHSSVNQACARGCCRHCLPAYHHCHQKAAQRRKLYQPEGRLPRLRRRAVAVVALAARGLGRRRALRLGLVLVRIVRRAAVCAALGLVAGARLVALAVVGLLLVRLVAFLAVILLGLAGGGVGAEGRPAGARGGRGGGRTAGRRAAWWAA